jgi:hypothetical protein
VRTTRLGISLLALAGLAPAKAQMFPPGTAAQYTLESDSGQPSSVVRTFSIAVGQVERDLPGNAHWISLTATKVSGDQFSVWLLSSAYPPATLKAARTTTFRYLMQEGSDEPREYRSAVTGEPVLPSSGAWEHLFPRAIDDGSPQRVRFLGHVYVQQSVVTQPAPKPPAAPTVIQLRPDMLVGPASNTRQKDETRRYDGSDYELVRLTKSDYREMAGAGINCVRVDAEQAPWADELNIFYWGDSGRLPYPELLYRTQYLGPTLYLDEPAVGARDHELRPRLEKDAAFRQSITPEVALDVFRRHFAKALAQVKSAMVKSLAARTDVDIGTMTFAQQNLHSWETMVSTAAWQLSQDPEVPEAMVFEPPGRIGTRRTLPEIDMTYGVQIPPDDPEALPAILFGFLRGAARLTGKNWGVSIYGAVQQADTFFWLTHAYELGATRFFFYDAYQLACVPYGEILAMARHLRAHANSNPHRDLPRLRRSAEIAILLPPGYNLGHVFLGKGPLWGLGELNLERRNRAGVKYRAVMSAFFNEIERCLRSGVAFDLLWDLPEMKLSGYRDVIRIAKDGEVRSDTNGIILPAIPLRPDGMAPDLAVSITGRGGADALELEASARVVEKAAPVYYTLGADTEGVYHNARVAWELYGPGEEDYVFIRPENLKPRVLMDGKVAHVEASIGLNRPGKYVLRAATVDLAGRTTVVWKSFEVSLDPATRHLSLRYAR